MPKTTTIKVGETAKTITLPEGKALTIMPTPNSTAAGMAYLLDQALGGSNSKQSWVIGATSLPPIGGYAGTQRIMITCAEGSIDAVVSEATLSSAAILRNAAGLALGFGAPNGDVISQLHIGVPSGVTWLKDTLNTFNLYAAGFSRVPTMFFDPSASAATSRGLGTINHPFYTQAQVQLACRGDMSGQVLGIKRGTTLRVNPGSGTDSGLALTVNGSAGRPFSIVPYGEGALPIITTCQIRADWAVDAGSVYKLTGITADTDAWQAVDGVDKRLWKKTSKAGLTGPGMAYYDSAATTLYIWPYNSADPNTGVMQLPMADYALNIRYSDVAATGYISVVGIDCRMGRNVSLRMSYPAGWTNITSCAGLEFVACRAGQAGVDRAANSTWASDAALMYGPGPTASIKATACLIIGCEGYDSLNNAFETANMDGFIQDGCYGHDCGGNVINELWANMTNAVIRNNFGLRASNAGRIYTAYHCGGIWSTIYNDIGGASAAQAHSAGAGHTFSFNIFAECETQGIELAGGAGHKILNNTFYQGILTPTNRLINLFSNCKVVGACGAEVSNNVVISSPVGNRNLIELVQGTVTAAAQGAINIPSAGNLVSTITGDNNIYLNWQAPSCNLISWTAAGSDTSGQSTWAQANKYKARVAPFDANSTAPFAPAASAANYMTPEYRPLAPLFGTGKTGYSQFTRYKDGAPYDPASVTLGALAS